MTTLNQVTPVTISSLTSATALTGNEATVIVQGGATVQAPISQYPQGMSAGVVVFGNTGGAPFPNFRTLKAGNAVTITDGGAQGDLTVSLTPGTGSGSVEDVSVVTANGVSGSVANPTVHPAITLTLGAITPASVAAVGSVTGSNLSGTNTGNVSLSGENYISLSAQALTANAVNLNGTNVTGTLAAARFGALIGDVTTTAGSYATLIASHAVTYAKMQQASTVTLLGNPTGGTANVSEVTLGSGLAFSGTTLTATGSGGTVTSVATGAGLTGGPITGSGTVSANTNLTHKVITLSLNGGGSAISAGGIYYISNIPYAGIITRWDIVADQSGSINIDVWKANAAIPTIANTITGGNDPLLSSAQSSFNGSVTSWSTAVSANDVMAFKVNSASTVQIVTLTIGVTIT